MNVHTSYPVFESGQVLSSGHLNDLVNYLEAQERETRNKLIGIGICCGFTIGLEPSGKVIRLGAGCAVTSAGYLIAETESLLDRFRPYTVPVPKLEEAPDDVIAEARYPFFFDGEKQIELWELMPTSHVPAPGEPALTAITAAFLADKVALLYLEANLESLKNCDINDCSDKGAQMNFALRKLLISRSDAETMLKREQDIAQRPVSRFNHPGYDLKELAIEKINPARHGIGAFNELYARITSLVLDLGPVFFDALKKGTTAYGYMLRELYPQAQFPNGPFVPGYFGNVQHQKAVNPLLIEYFYDYVYDAVQAYNEFVRTALQVEAECCPNPDRFPRHVLLGEIKATTTSFTPPAQPKWDTFDPLAADTGLAPAVKPAPFRHHFVPSPLLDRRHHGLRRVQALHTRLYLLAYRYSTQKLIPAELRITPSRSGDYALSDKAIPFYYAFNPADDFHRCWSFEDTSANRLDQVQSYQFIDAAKHPLLNRMERHNFLRVEGIVGMPLGQAIEELKKQKRELGLSFGIEPVYLGVAVQGNSASASLDEKAQRLAQRILLNMLACRLGDLEAVFLVFMGALFAYIRAAVALLSSLNTTKVAQWAAARQIGAAAALAQAVAAAPGASSARGQIKIDAKESEAALKELRGKAYVKGELTNRFTSVKDAKLAVGQLYADIKANPADLFDRTREFAKTLGVAGDIDAITQKVFRPIVLIDRAEDLITAVRAPALAEFDFEDFAVKYDAFSSAFDLYAADAEIGIEKADPAIVAANRELLASYGAVAGSTPKVVVGNLATELRERIIKAFDEMSLKQYARKHPGMEHRAGVPVGGTLVLIYAHKKSLADVLGTQGEFLDAKNKEVDAKLAPAPGHVPPKADTKKIFAAIPGGDDLRDEFVVVADFCLPYLCCDSDCSEAEPRVSAPAKELPDEKPKLPEEQPKPPEEKPKDLPGTIKGTISGRASSTAPVNVLVAATVKITDITTGAAINVTMKEGVYGAAVPVGKYRIDVASPRFNAQNRTVAVNSGAALTEDFTLIGVG